MQIIVMIPTMFCTYLLFVFSLIMAQKERKYADEKANNNNNNNISQLNTGAFCCLCK